MGVAVFDIDGTLADESWRRSMWGDWDEYHRASANDPPITIVISLLNALVDSGLDVVLMTGRPERWRGLTVSYLTRHGVKATELIMRPNDNYQKSPDLKITMAEGRFGPDLKDLVMIVDDRDDVLSAFRARGVTAMRIQA